MCCDEPVGPEQVTLIDPRGKHTKLCGPYCAEDVVAVQRVLIPRYSGTGAPAFVVQPYPTA
jgi:hypothetical protein